MHAAMAFVAFVLPWIFVCLVAWALLVFIARRATQQTLRKAREDIEGKAAEGTVQADGDLVALRGRLRVDGEGCATTLGSTAKVAAKSVGWSRRAGWPKKAHVGDRSDRCARLVLETKDGEVLLEGPIAVAAGSRLRFKTPATRRDEGGPWFGGESLVFDGDEVVALGMRHRGPQSIATADAGYREAAGRHVLTAPGEDEPIVVAAQRSQAPVARLAIHPVMLIAALVAVLPSWRTAASYADAATECKQRCDDDGRCSVALKSVSGPGDAWNSIVANELFTCEAADDAACRGSTDCLELGRCSAVRGECVAAKDQDCRHTPYCVLQGNCGVVDGKCQATRDEHCRDLSSCADHGECRAIDGVCRVGSDEDCARSGNCGALGWCSKVGEACKAKTRDDCQKYSRCALAGQCTPVDGNCEIRSSKDCGLTFPCLQSGACTFVAGQECVVKTDSDCLLSQECARYRKCRADNGACVQDADSCRTSAACRVHGRCEGDDRCEVATDRDCQASEGCKERGACRKLGGQCLKSCADSEACRSMGYCHEVDGDCAASDAGCRPTQGCRDSGRCTARPEGCVVASDKDCKTAAVCRQLGHCTSKNGECIASGDDCFAASACKHSGACLAKDGSCTTGRRDELCRKDPRCKELGWCGWGFSRCRPTSNEDCRESDVCRQHGWCDKVGDECFIAR
jgi:hypothetical protein